MLTSYMRLTQLGELRGSDLILDRSKGRSEWAEQCPYMGMKSIFRSDFVHRLVQKPHIHRKKAQIHKVFVGKERKINTATEKNGFGNCPSVVIGLPGHK